MKIKIYVSIGDAIDRLSILQIKQEKIKCKNSLKLIKKEKKYLKKSLKKIKSYKYFLKKIKKINVKMWNCNDERKNKIKKNKIDSKYLKLTIQESELNDKRYLLKKEIDLHFNSEIKEQKNYKWLN